MAILRMRFRFITIIAVAVVFLTITIAIADATFATYSSAHSNDVTYTEVNLSTPSSTASGDLLLANIAVRGGSEAVITEIPYGWTQIRRTDNDVHISVISYYKLATSSNQETYTWKFQDQTTGEGAISRYVGVNTANPIAASTGNTGFGESATTSSLTTAVASTTIVNLFATDVGKAAQAPYFSTPSGTSERYDLNNAPFGPSTASSDAVQVASGLSSVATTTINGNKARFWASQQVALSPAPAPTITFDAATQCGSSSSCSVTTSGSNRALVAFVNGQVGTDSTPSCTYDGVSMTLVDKVQTPSDRWIYGFLLLGPSTGTNTLSCSGSSYIRINAVSYNNVQQSGQPDNYASGSNSSSYSLTTNYTVINANSLIVADSYFAQANNPTTTIAYTSSTDRVSNDGSRVHDSNGPLSATTTTVTMSDNITSNRSQIIISLIPAE